MAQQPKDFEWLKQQLISLLESAMKAEVRDHQACAKYADLLYKMLPRRAERASSGILDQIREAISNEKKGASGRVEKAKDPDRGP